MIIDASVRRQFRLQSSLFLILFVITLGLLAWLSQQHTLTIDLSKNPGDMLHDYMAGKRQRYLSKCTPEIFNSCFVFL